MMSPAGHHVRCQHSDFSIRLRSEDTTQTLSQAAMLLPVTIKYLEIIKSQVLIVGRAQSSGIFMVIFIIFDWLSRLRIFVKL